MVGSTNFGIDKVRLYLPSEAVAFKKSWQDAGMTLDRGKVFASGETSAKGLFNDADGIVEGSKAWLNNTELGYVLEANGNGFSLTFNPSAGRSLADSGEEVRQRTLPIFKDIRKFIKADWGGAALKQIDCTQDSYMKYLCPTYKSALNVLSMKRQADNKLEYPDSVRFGRRGRNISIIAYDRGKKLADQKTSTNLLRVESQITSRKDSDKVGKLFNGLRTFEQMMSFDFDEMQHLTRSYLKTDLFRFSPSEAGQQVLPIVDILSEFDYALEHEKQVMRAINIVSRWHSTDALLKAVGGMDGLADRLKEAGKSARTIRHVIAYLRQELNNRAARKKENAPSLLTATYGELLMKFAA